MLLTEISDRVAHGDVEPILALDRDFELKQHKAYPSILAIQLSDVLEREVLLFNLVVMGKRNVYNKFLREYTAITDVRHWPCDLDVVSLKVLPFQKKMTSREKRKHHEVNKNWASFAKKCCFLTLIFMF